MSQNLSAPAWVKTNISRRGLLSASGYGRYGFGASRMWRQLFGQGGGGGVGHR